MFYRSKKYLDLKRFDFATREIRDKAQISLDPDARFCLVTQLQDSDINMYLIAVSSFCRFLLPKRIVVASDNLSQANTRIIKRCIPQVEIVPIEEFQSNSLPKGGTWERLQCILSLVGMDYVIQLDADTITLNYPFEVQEAISQNRSFTIVSNPNAAKMTLKDISEVTTDWMQSHVQVKSEQAMGRLRDSQSRNYVRGCSAFTGFAKGSTSIAALEEFSQEMASLIGIEKWSEWGSEQVSSSYLIANTEGPVCLPFESYPFFRGDSKVDFEKAKLIHFIGSHRFKSGLYQQLARQLINIL